MTYLEELKNKWMDRKVIFEGIVYTVIGIDSNGALLIDKADQFKTDTAVAPYMVEEVEE